MDDLLEELPDTVLVVVRLGHKNVSQEVIESR